MSEAPDAAREDRQAVSLIETPPTKIAGILKRLGPGMVIAASIVGSGELIATTKTGAEAGFVLLWLIIIGCVIKVFTQVEFGRFAITEGHGTMEALNLIPGPRLRVNWLMWYWLVMAICSFGQLGGIVGIVGRMLAEPVPITGDYREQAAAKRDQEKYDRKLSELRAAAQLPADQNSDTIHQAKRREEIAEQFAHAHGARPELAGKYVWDDVIWSGIVTAITATLLVAGRYRMVQTVSTILVVGCTLVTIINLVMLQTTQEYAISLTDIGHGLSFQLPAKSGNLDPVFTALATFGIIGVGATELISYPYWCLEYGYARYAGPKDSSSAWVERARGWLRVMRWDCWCSMVVYTVATIAFYLLGATVLHRMGQVPDDSQVVPVLQSMYDHVFGKWAGIIFRVCALAVLYKTFYVATAGHARTTSDAIRVFGLGSKTPENFRWWVQVLCGVLPFVCFAIYAINKNPVTLVMLSGMAQAIMLPMLGGAAIYYRYRRADPRITPGRVWDFFLFLSFAGLLVAGLWGAWQQVQKLLG